MPTLWLPGAIFPLLLILAPGVLGAEIESQMSLAWKFKKGDVLRYQIHYKTETRAEAEPGVQAVGNPPFALVLTVVWSVTKAGDGAPAEVSQTIEHVREETRERSPDGQRLVFDSSDPRSIDNPWSALRGEVYRHVIGAPYSLIIDRRGDLVDVRLPKDVLKGWKPLSLRPREGRDFLFRKDGVKELLSTLPKLPGVPVRRGEPWRSQREMAVGSVRTTLVEVFSPAGQEDPLVMFKAKPEITMHVNPHTVRQGDKQDPSADALSLISANAEKQSGESKLTFDLAAGRVTNFSRQHRYEVNCIYQGTADSKTPRTNKTKFRLATLFEIRLLSARSGH